MAQVRAKKTTKKPSVKKIAKSVVSKQVIQEKEALIEIPEAPTRSAFTPTLHHRKRKTYLSVLALGLFLEAFLLGLAFVKIQYLEKSQAQQPLPAGGSTQAPGDIEGKTVKVDNGHLPVLGNPNAKVTLIEFADFRCPFCERFYTSTLSQIKKDYIDTGKVKVYFRHYAFLGPASDTAANAAECANDQGKFWDMYNYFYEHQPSESDTSMYTVDTLTQIAGRLRMDTNKFKSCLSSTKDNKNVTGDFTAGSTAGVTGTPTVFVDGIAIVGAQPYASFKQVIDVEVKKHAGFFGLF